MQTKLTHTKDYLLLIDEDAEIRDRDYFIRDNPPLDFKPKRFIEKRDVLNPSSKCNRIKAWYPLTKESKELDLLLLPNPFEEDFWETVPVKWVKWNKKKPHWNGAVWLQFNGKNQGRGIVHNGKLISLEGDKVSEEFIRDYQDTFYWLLQETDKAAQSKQFSLEDMIAFGKKCFYKGFDKSENDDANCFTAWKEEANELLQSLSTQQLPKEFIPEYEYYYHSSKEFYKDAKFERCSKEQYDSIKEEIPTCPVKVELKTITNSEGKQEIQGRYVY